MNDRAIQKRRSSVLEKVNEENLSANEFELSEPHWTFLPSVCLAEIYSYLSHSNKTNMSLVCKRWTHEFDAPCNWRRVTFRFPMGESLSTIHPNLKFVRRFGRLFREVHICYVFGRLPYDSECGKLCLLCKNLSEEVQLQSLSVDYAVSLVEYSDCGNCIIGSISMLLNSQKHLQVLELQLCCLTKKDVLTLLNAIGDRSSLQRLRFWDNDQQPESFFFSDANFIDDKEENTHWFCSCLHSLKCWEIDYSSVLCDVVTHFVNHLKKHNVNADKTKGVLESLCIYYDDESLNYIERLPSISSESWKSFKNLFPKLSVNLEIEFVDSITARIQPIIESVIKKWMPLRSLKLSMEENDEDDDWNEPLNTYELLDRLVFHGLNLQLEKLQLATFECPDFLEDLNAFLPQFPNLKIIAITAPVLYQMEEILHFWTTNSKGLKEVKLKLTRQQTRHEFRQLCDIKKHFVPIFQEKGIILSIHFYRSINFYKPEEMDNDISSH